jgi:hypothetical protein
MKHMKALCQKSYDYTIVKDEATGNLFMDVLLGGAAMYGFMIQLLPEEIEVFNGYETDLDYLADQVRGDPKRFAARGRYV